MTSQTTAHLAAINTLGFVLYIYIIYNIQCNAETNPYVNVAFSHRISRVLLAKG